MKELSVTIDKETVYGAVEKTTAYTGAKKNETGSYDRISLTDENHEMLDQFWTECRGTVAALVKEVVTKEREADGQWVLELRVSNLFDERLLASLALDLTDYFVQEICSKWFAITSPGDDAVAMAARAAASLEAARQVLYHRMRPRRIDNSIRNSS